MANFFIRRPIFAWVLAIILMMAGALAILQLPVAQYPTIAPPAVLNRPGFPGECFICELRLPDHRFRWKHNKLFLLL
uniref:efflux RND transporter permease subunit n=1 Tax=Shigella boydii TaxID=621 RepID=UPI001491ECD0